MVKYGLIPDDENHHPNSSSNSSGSSTPRHFFIPIFSTPSSTTTSQPFCIPKAFMKYLLVWKKKIKKKSHEKGREVLEAILRSNGRGKSFHVNMVMDKDGRLMSDDEHEHHQQVEEDEDEYVQQARGWKNFSDYHDLQVGDFLLFRHLGSLSFDVIVFDSTTCQRKYPPLDPPFFFFDHATTGKNFKTTTPDRAKRANADADDTPSNQFITSLKHYNFSQWMMTIPRGFARSNGLGNKTCTITFRDEKGRSWPIDLRHKKTRDQAYVRGGWREFIEGNGLKEGDICTFELVSRRGGTNNIVFDVYRGCKTTTSDHPKRADADEAAAAGATAAGATAAGSSNESTPSKVFTTRLKYYNFSHSTMTIPAKFVRSNGLDNQTCMIIFRDEKGRSWPIKLGNKGGNQVYVRGGWPQFIKGNGLKEGDVCTFELESRRGGTKNIVFDVRRDSKTTTPDQAKRADADADAAASGSSNDDDTPSNQFTTPLKHYSFTQWTMTLPVKFVRSNGLGNKTCTITFRDEKKRSWPIGLRYKKSSGEVYIYGGWRQFIEGNGLKEGDVCTFELVSRRGTKNIIFDVHRGSKTTTPGQAKRADADGAEAAGSSNDDDTPSSQFTTTLKHYNLSQWTMSIPTEFTRSNGLGNKTCTITFIDEKGRSWPIDLRYKKSRDRFYVRGGWREFIEGNGLKEGDVCTFELLSRRGRTKNIVFDVRRGSKTTTPDQAKRADAYATTAAENSDESTPSNKFITRLKHNTFSQWRMTIPTEIVRSNGLGNKTCTITFRDEKGRSWPVHLRNKGCGQVYVQGGWRLFIEGNGLKEGDVCTFELVSRRGGTKNIIFDVRRGHH